MHLTERLVFTISIFIYVLFETFEKLGLPRNTGTRTRFRRLTAQTVAAHPISSRLLGDLSPTDCEEADLIA